MADRSGTGAVAALIATNIFFSIGVIFANKHLFQHLDFRYSTGARAYQQTPQQRADGPALDSSVHGWRRVQAQR